MLLSELFTDKVDSRFVESIRSSSLISELFDTSSPLTWIDNDQYMKRDRFDLNGQTYQIEIYQIDDKKGIWGIIYGIIDGSRMKLSPTGTSGTEASKVLGSVVNAVGDFLQHEHPNALLFSGAKGHGLFKLYDLMLRNLRTKVDGLGYKIEVGVDGSSSKFALVDKRFENFEDVESSNVNEAFDTTTPVDWIKWGGDEFVGRFKVNDQLFEIEFSESSPGIWKLYYGAKTNGADQDPQFSPTGTSGTKAIHVLSAVVNIVLEFIKQQQPKLLRFSGSKAAGLGDLYTKMSRFLEPKLNAIGYHMDNKDSGAQQFFGIRKGLKDENK